MQFRFTSLFLLLCSWGSMLFAQSGQSVDLSFAFEGDVRTYQLYVPADYDGSEAWPLVLNLHGFGANSGIQVFTAQMNEIADTARFLVAYPQGLNTIGPDGSEGSGWNADWWTGRDDVGALSKLIDHAWTNYEVDLSRVYATGLDNGGQMSLALACELNDRIAAVGGVAVPFTTQQRDSCLLGSPVPALLMHGTADVITPFDGVPGVLLSAPELAATWAEYNNCDAAPDTTMLPDIDMTDSSTVNLYTYNNCEMDAEVRLYETVDGGHTWSGGPPAPPGFEILGNVNRDVSSSVEMWNFFEPFTHPDPREGTVIEEGDVGLLQRTITIDGVERRYSVYVPADYDGSEAWPMVINMHGFAASSNDQLTVSDMNPVADTAHFLIAYPQGLVRESLGDEGPGWNAGRSPELADDVGFISALIDQVFQEFGIDLARVYATGLSQGGSMSYLLASDLGDRIAAIAPVAATMETGVEYAPSRTMPLLQIHGTADGLVPYDGSDVLPLTSVEYILQFWLDNNGCAGDPVETELPDLNTMDNSTVTQFEYNNCNDDTEVVHYRVNGGGHTWPGGPGSPVFFGPTNQDFHASSTIWNFFARHEHPDPAGVAQLLNLSLTHENTTRTYKLYLPAAYDGSEEWPLVINSHGAGGNADLQIFASAMNEVADTAHFLIAYPEGIIEVPNFPGFAWNATLDPNGPDDLGFISKMIDALNASFNIDLSRVYASGLSNGGYLSYALACELSDRIAAVASVAGPRPEEFLEPCQVGRPFPILHIHGTADPIVSINGGTSPVTGLTSPPARSEVQFWLDNNGCTTDSTLVDFPDIDTEDGSTVQLRQFTSCDTYTDIMGVERTAEVLYYRIEGGGHTWPGGPPAPPAFDFLGNVNMDISGSSEIWNFFNRHQHPDPAPAPQLLDLSLTHDDTTRNYKLYVPAAYDGSEAWPLVISYHEVGNTVDEYLDVIRTNEVADTAHFLIAYPVGLDVFNAVLNQVDPGWNDGFLPSQTDADDVGFTSSLIDSIAADYNVDQARVYAMGPGNGGAMAARAACELSNRIAAMADVQGFIDCTPPVEVPGLFMFGTADPFVPIEGIPGLLPPFWEGVGNWAAANGCEADSTETQLPDLVTDDNSTVTLIEYPNCSADSEVLFYRVDGGGRTWPGGGPIPAGGPTNRDIIADVEIWKFFNRFNLETTAVTTLAASEIDLQVFPNPFSEQLTFHFELPAAAQVQLRLFNQLGQAVANVVDEQLPEGAHRLQWNAEAQSLPAGMYYYRLRVGNRFVTRPVVLSSVKR